MSAWDAKADIATAIFEEPCAYCPMDRPFVWRPEFYEAWICRPRQYLSQRPASPAAWLFLFRSVPPAASHAAHEGMAFASIAQRVSLPLWSRCVSFDYLIGAGDH